MDFFRFAHPWVLMLLAPAWAAVFWPALRRRRDRTAAARAVLGGLASTLLLVALASPSLRLHTRGLGPERICAVQDVSRSMALARRPGDAADPRDLLRRALPGPTARVQVAGTVAAATPPGSPWPSSDAPVPAAEATDLGAGLDQAAALLPEGDGLVLLITDGRETRGNAVLAARRLAARGLRVDALLPDLAPPHDARLVSLAPLATSTAGPTVRLEVRLAASAATDADLVLIRRSDATATVAVASTRVSLDPRTGATLRFDDTPPAPGVYTYVASVRATDDTVPENDQAACTVRVGDARRIAYVYDGAAPSATLAWLRDAAPAASTVQTVPVAQVRQALADTDLLVFDNVPAWTLDRPAQDALADRVTRGGLSLLVLGGDAAFGAGGYAEAPLDALLPVASRTARRPPVDLVLVVDASGSMNEKVGGTQKLALAKQAILALRPALGPGDRVGVVAFAGEPRTVSPLTAAGGWSALESHLLALQAGGGTRITPAVQAALTLFGDGSADPATLRHLLLLSDGRSEDFAVDALAAACRTCRAGLTAIATGTDADRPRLAALTAATGGRLYEPDDLGRLAGTFFQELARIRGEALDPRPRAIQWINPAPVWPYTGPNLGDVPALNPTRLRDGATLHWAAPADDANTPLLASWQRGLGRVAAMPWPVSLRAAARSAQGDPMTAPLTRLVAYLAGPSQAPTWSAEITTAARPPSHLRVTRRPESLASAAPTFTATVFAADASAARDLPLTQTAPGLFEAALSEADAAGSLIVVRAEGGGEAGTAWLSAPGAPPPEFARFGVDRAHLEAIVRAGGGQVHATPESVREVVAHLEAAAFVPVGLPLVWAAGAVVIALVGLRLVGKL